MYIYSKYFPSLSLDEVTLILILGSHRLTVATSSQDLMFKLTPLIMASLGFYHTSLLYWVLSGSIRSLSSVLFHWLITVPSKALWSLWGLYHSSWDHHQNGEAGTAVKQGSLSLEVGPRSSSLQLCYSSSPGDPRSLAQGSPILLLTLTRHLPGANFPGKTTLTPFPCNQLT